MTGIRPAVPGDIDAIMAIEQTAFDPERRASRRSLIRALGSARQIVMVCESAGRVVGYAILWRFEHTWRLYSIATDPAVQGGGVGTGLLEAAIAAARGSGARWLQLEARPAPALTNWYAKHGFRPIATLSDYYGPGDDAVRMRLCFRRDVQRGRQPAPTGTSTAKKKALQGGPSAI